MKELESHRDHEDAAKNPGDRTVDEEDIRAEKSGEKAEREKGQNCSHTEGGDESEYCWKGEGGFTAGKVADKTQADDTVAWTYPCKEAEDQNASE